MTAQEFSIGDVTRVEHWFAGKLAPARGVRIAGWERIPFGHSNDTFRLALEWVNGDGAHTERFVVRRDIVHGIMEPYDIPTEFRLLRALEKTAVAAPRVYWLEEDPAVMGAAFYVMEECHGQQPPDLWQMRGFLFEATPAERRDFIKRYVEQLAAIHTLDWQALGLSRLGEPLGFDFGGPPRDGTTDCAERAVIEWTAKARQNHLEPEPLFVEPIAWLRRHLPVTPRVTLTHGDCKLSNYMFRDGRIVGIFDWEWARLSDPMSDLAWSGFLGTRPGVLLDGMLTPAEFHDYYESLTGIPVQMENVRFFSIIGALKASSFYPGFGRVFQQELSHDLRYGGMGYTGHSTLVRLNHACGLYAAEVTPVAAGD